MEKEKQELKEKSDQPSEAATEKNYKLVGIGHDMVTLIKYVGEKFEKEYGFKPSIIDITDLIAKRAMKNSLF